MEILIDIVLPIFGTLFIAYIAARTKLFSTKATEGLATFVFTFAVPSLLFDSVSRHPLPDPIEWELLISFFGTAYLIWLAVAVKTGFCACVPCRHDGGFR